MSENKFPSWNTSNNSRPEAPHFVMQSWQVVSFQRTTLFLLFFLFSNFQSQRLCQFLVFCHQPILWIFTIQLHFCCQHMQSRGIGFLLFPLKTSCRKLLIPIPLGHLAFSSYIVDLTTHLILFACLPFNGTTVDFSVRHP